MRALVVAPQPFYSPRGTPLSVYYRTLVLSQLGVEVDLLTYGDGQDVEIPSVRIFRIPRLPFLGPVPVGPSWTKFWLDGLLILWTLGRLVRNRYDFVHAHEEAVFFCRFLRPLFGFRLLYDMHSSLPQQLTNFRFTRSRGLIWLFEKLEESSLKSADAVITISPVLAEQALAKVRDPDRHFLIENSIFEPVRVKGEPGPDKTPECERSLPDGRTVICYAGTFEEYQGLDLLIPAFAQAARARPDLFLLMVGGTPEQVERYRRLAGAEGVGDDCLFCGALGRNESQRLMARSDLLVSPRSHGTNTPLKIYELLASGKPFVASRIVSHTQVLSEDVCFLADPQPSALAAAILTAVDDPRAAEIKVAAARALYERRYSRSIYEGKMRRLLEVLG